MATALLVLDMLTDFTSGKLANPAARQITEPIAELIQAARGRDDWIVVYGNDAHRPGDFELSVFGEHAMADSPGAAVIEELAPLPGDIIGFLETFGHSFLAGLSGQARDEYLHEVRLLLEPQLVNADGVWVADYVRLRFAAERRS